MKMRTSARALFLFVLLFGIIPPTRTSAEITTAVADYPVRLTIPSLNINSPIQGVGTNSRGEMDVPSGKTKNVGWYKYGAVPGESGSAVLDAHVFAAFKQLKYVKPNADIYVTMASGQKLHFVVSAARTYPLKNLTSSTLFATDGYPRLNLITCAGNLTKDRTTYDHRLIVYTTLAGVTA